MTSLQDCSWAENELTTAPAGIPQLNARIGGFFLNRYLRRARLGLWGFLLTCAALSLFAIIALAALPARLIFGPVEALKSIVWWVGLPLVLGMILLAFDAIFLAPIRKRNHILMNEPIHHPSVTVVLTAYNDALSIGESVADFKQHPLVTRVVVVDNNSSDNTFQEAASAGAIVVSETKQGYGHCVFRALSEGCSYEDTPLVALCEGDMSFRAQDLDKLIAYIPHAQVVNGTRIVEQLRAPVTQLTIFMYWANFLGGKMLEIKHLGRGTVTDLGTTYKLSRTSFLQAFLPKVDPNINLEFNAHFLDVLLNSDAKLVEAPVTFHPRIGESKGGNVSNRRAIRVGVRMFTGMLFSWKFVRSE